MQPDEIHELGLREVARIEAEQLEIAKRLGFADLKSFRDSIPKIPALHPKSRQAIIDEYQQYTTQMYAKLPELFESEHFVPSANAGTSHVARQSHANPPSHNELSHDTEKA